MSELPNEQLEEQLHELIDTTTPFLHETVPTGLPSQFGDVSAAERNAYEDAAYLGRFIGAAMLNNPTAVRDLRVVSRRAEQGKEIQRQVDYDELTGLETRRHFMARLTARVNSAKAAGEFGIAFIDLDGFKGVNDTLGHKMGDQVLAAVGHIYRIMIRRFDVAARWIENNQAEEPEDDPFYPSGLHIGRLGGDEFVILAELSGAGKRRAEKAKSPRTRLIEFGNRLISITGAVSDNPNLKLQGRRIGASIGLAPWYPGMSAADILREADLAMLKAKESRREQSGPPTPIVLWQPDSPYTYLPHTPQTD